MPGEGEGSRSPLLRPSSPMTAILSLAGLFLASVLLPFDFAFHFVLDSVREARRLRVYRRIHRVYRALYKLREKAI